MSGPQLLILSRRNAEAYAPQGVEIRISISDPDLEEAHLFATFWWRIGRLDQREPLGQRH